MTDDSPAPHHEQQGPFPAADGPRDGRPGRGGAVKGVGPFTARELIIVIVGGVALLTSFFSISRYGFLPIWASGLDWILAALLPAAGSLLILLRRLTPTAVTRVGSLSIDQFASVAFSVASVVWLSRLIWGYQGAEWLFSWVPWLQLLLMVAGVFFTVAAPMVSPFREDFDDRDEVIAARAARPARPVAQAPRPAAPAGWPQHAPGQPGGPGQQGGYAPYGYDAHGNPLPGHGQSGYAQQGHPPAGYATDGYTPQGYPTAQHASQAQAVPESPTPNGRPSFVTPYHAEAPGADSSQADAQRPAYGQPAQGPTSAPAQRGGGAPHEGIEGLERLVADAADGRRGVAREHARAGGPGGSEPQTGDPQADAGTTAGEEARVEETASTGDPRASADGGAPASGEASAPDDAPVSEDLAAQQGRVEPARATPASSQPFWALVPVERDVVDVAGRPLFRIGPTAWALVLEDRGEVFVVRHDDGRVGFLHDVSGVTRG